MHIFGYAKNLLLLARVGFARDGFARDTSPGMVSGGCKERGEGASAQQPTAKAIGTKARRPAQRRGLCFWREALLKPSFCTALVSRRPAQVVQRPARPPEEGSRPPEEGSKP